MLSHNEPSDERAEIKVLTLRIRALDFEAVDNGMTAMEKDMRADLVRRRAALTRRNGGAK